MKKSILINTLLFVAGFVLVKDFCANQTEGFSLLEIASNRPVKPNFATRPLTPQETDEATLALDQQFNYFSFGGQCYVFESIDQKYVIKFFKQSLYELPTWLKLGPLPWPFNRYYEKKKFKRCDKLQRDFKSYKLSFDLLKEESALLFVHLNKTEHLKKVITIVDKLGIKHSVDLDKYDFVLQKKAEHFYPKIDSLMSAGKIEDCKKLIDNALKLILICNKKGILDKDPAIQTNCGFLGDRAIKIDVGRMALEPSMKVPEIYKKELTRIAEPFQDWINHNHPALSQHIQDEIAQLMEDDQ